MALIDLPTGLGLLVTAGRWGVGLALLLLALWLVLRYAPGRRRPARWVTLGSGLTIAGWIGASVLYGLYVRHVADYESLFGAFATVIVFMSYLYLVCVVFLAGAQVDAFSRERLDGGGAA